MKIQIEHNGKLYFVKKPGYKELADAKFYSAKVFNQARLSGAMLKKQLWDYMREIGLWDDAKEAEMNALLQTISENTTELEKGKNGKFKTLSEARKAAIDVRIARIKEHILLSEYTNLDSYTIEGLAEQAHFDSLISNCIYLDNGNKAFPDIESYFEAQNQPWVKLCAEEISYFLHPEIQKNWEQELPENKFLTKYGFLNSELRLINKDGHLVNKENQLVDNEGNLVDKDGNILNAEGQTHVPVEFSEFENDL